MAENTLENSGKRRRKLRNYIYNARLSKRYHVYALGVLIMTGFCEAYAIRLLRGIGVDLATTPGIPLEIQQAVAESLLQSGLLFFVIFLITAAFVVLFILVLEQRVGGPTVAILATLEEYKKGNYDYRRKLRDNDELKNIMDGLHHLAQQLKEKNSK